MRIIRLEIKNFRAIKSLKLTNLGDVVVIAGPNGSGKSSIFDAIRLLKSGYGGYQDNEVQQWFNEFQINLNQRSEDILSLLQDRNQPLEITAEFLFNDKEKNHILNEWEKLENDQMWYNSSSERLPQQFISTTSTSLAYSLYQTNPKIQDSNLVQISSFKEELKESAYLPEAKIVILEGGGDTEFDKRMVSLLFPQFSSKVNIISGGNKKRVADLYQILEKVSRDADISAKVYAINDSDINISNLQNKSDIIESNCYTWNVYHIENYLLEPHFIIKVIQEINFSTQDYTEDKIYAQLKKFASDSIRFEVEEKLRNYVNNLLIKQLDLSFDPKIQALGSEFSKVVQRCYERIGKVSTNELSKDKLIVSIAYFNTTRT